MKRDNELQKPVAHTSIWLGKRESDQKKYIIPKKPKANSSNWNIKNFGHRSHKEMYCFKKIKWYVECRAKWKALKNCTQIYVGVHICIFQ